MIFNVEKKKYNPENICICSLFVCTFYLLNENNELLLKLSKTISNEYIDRVIKGSGPKQNKKHQHIRSFELQSKT